MKKKTQFDYTRTKKEANWWEKKGWILKDNIIQRIYFYDVAYLETYSNYNFKKLTGQIYVKHYNDYQCFVSGLGLI